MPIQPKEFLDVARKVCPTSPPANEAEARTAQGRAYYAAHLTIRDALADIGILPPKENSHQWVIQKLRTSKDDDLQDMADMLSGMLGVRHLADYAPRSHTVTVREGILSAVRAEQLLRDFGKFTPAQLKAAIRP